MNKDEYFLKEAIKQAKKAGDIGDVPIGCVIVFEDKIIARGYNRRNKDKSTLSHAEIIAIKKGCKKLGDNARALSDVCRCNSPVQNKKGSSRSHESESRMCRFHYKYFANRRLQSQNGSRTYIRSPS